MIGELSEVPIDPFMASGKSATVDVEDHVRWHVQTRLILLVLAAGPLILVMLG